MPENNSADFTSLFSIQTKYLADLLALTPATGSTGIYTAPLRTNLEDLYRVYGNALPASSVALDNQTQMYDIIQKEQQRIMAKKSGIDNAYTAQQRLVQLNESYREKNMKYIDILIIIIISIVIYLALLMMSRHLTFIPAGIINLLTALLFSISFIIICIKIAKINKRDNMNFQKLLFVPPDNSGNFYGNVYGNLDLNMSGTCIGNICCGQGTQWDYISSTCIPINTSTTSGFTLMGGFNGNNNCNKCNSQGVPYIPYTPFEFDSYAKI